MQHDHAPDRDDFNARAIPAIPQQRPARAARIPGQPGTEPAGNH
ncbi:hypothetical protein ACFWB2_20900 [Streptomyces virginiae]